MMEFNDYVIINLTSHILDFAYYDESEIKEYIEITPDFSVEVDDVVNIKFGDAPMRTINDKITINKRYALATPDAIAKITKYINMDTNGKFKLIVVSFPTLNALNTLKDFQLYGDDYAIVSTTNIYARNVKNPNTGKKPVIASAIKFTTL